MSARDLRGFHCGRDLIRQIDALFVGIEVAAVADVEIVAAKHSALRSGIGA